MSKVPRWYWGLLVFGLLGCVWMVTVKPLFFTPLPLFIPPSDGVNILDTGGVSDVTIHDASWIIPVWVTGPDGKTPCLLKFRQLVADIPTHLLFLDATTCPVQDASGRVVAKDRF